MSNEERSMSEKNAPGSAPGPESRSAKTEERLSGRAQRKVAEREAAKKRTLFTILGGIAAVALIGLLAFVLTRKPEVAPVAMAPAMDESLAFAGRTMGDPNAPVKVVEWGDYQ
jgi:hypothetical protein